MSYISAPSSPLALNGVAEPVRRKRSLFYGQWPTLVLFLPPAFTLFSLLVILPMTEAAWYSFYNWNGYGTPSQWVGFRNYLLIFRNPAFTQALINNGLIVVASLCVQLPLALWLATMVTKPIKGALLFRLVFFLPFVLADVAAGMIWSFVYDGDFGLIGGIARSLGMDPPFWLADRDTAMYAILAVIVWKYFGFHMMLFIAGLQAIDKSILEAADIDGASGFQKFRLVTLPLLGSTLRLSIFFAIVGSLQFFDMIMPLTGGGPSNSTQTMVTFLYNFGVKRMQVGLGSAVGVVLCVICILLTFGYKRIFMRHD